MADIKQPKLNKLVPKFLSLDDVKVLLNSLAVYAVRAKRYKRNQLIILIFIYTGIRANELFNIKLTDINLKNGTILITKGKGERERYIPIASQLRPFLATHIQQTGGPYLFGPCPLKHSSLRRLFAALNRTIPHTHITPHILRHTFATLMIEGGADIRSLQELMGHSDIKTTAVYLHCSSGRLNDVIMKHPLN